MQSVRSKDTRPELAVRRAVHHMGFRYRLHVRTLPGTPDIVFPSRRKIIFVHGCFWHQHEGCPRARLPKTRPDYWLPKLARTPQRDAASIEKLQAAGWSVLVVWECELAAPAAVHARLRAFLAG